MGDSSNKSENIWKKGVAHVIDLLSSLFLPFINLMVSVGILKGILVLMVANGIVTDGTATYDILNAMSDAFFYFIPLFLAYTAAKKFDVEPVLGNFSCVYSFTPQYDYSYGNRGNSHLLWNSSENCDLLCFCNSHSSGYLLYEFCSEVLL